MLSYLSLKKYSSCLREALNLFTKDELMVRPIPQEAVWKSEVPFQGEDGVKALEILHQRINQHVYSIFFLLV